MTEPGMATKFARRLGGTFKTGLAVVGVTAIAAGCLEYRRLFPAVDTVEEEKKKKRVLVVPFHRLQLVERKDASFRTQIAAKMNDSDSPIQMEVRELVDLLHHAASDSSIAAVYGIFGHGGTGIASAGWADLEEVRNALQVIKESHRRHPEPNVSHQMQVIPCVQSKPLYAYADSFSSEMNPSNKDYYLASVFSHIHMQQNGELNLFGMVSQQFFVRDMLEKYGIQLHVFKHGNFKNFPNMFTHTGFNHSHRENVTSLQNAVNENVCDDITRARSKALLTSWLTKQHKSGDGMVLWKKIHDSGTFPAETAWKAGLIDFLPRRNPLPDLVKSNKEDATKEEVSAKWKLQETDFERFKADSSVELKDYAKHVSTKKKAAEKRQRWTDFLTKHGTINSMLSSVGFTGYSTGRDSNPKESIALLQVDGAIGSQTANKLIKSIRKIAKDDTAKCVVVRVSSPGGAIVPCETILEELKGLELPLVFSFGNVSASGGYYIASAADRIFCSEKSITGSIGVFGIRMDLTGLASQYGINAQHVATGDLGGSYLPFAPMSRKMKQNMAANVDRYYSHFKSIVAEGRNIPIENVEALAQGRVWSGNQAKSNGLVDELGGLTRALAYARRTYTSNDQDDAADVIVYPEKQSVLERLVEAKENNSAAMYFSVLYEIVTGSSPFRLDSQASSAIPVDSMDANIIEALVKSKSIIPANLSGVMMTADENAAIQCLLENVQTAQNSQSFPASFWR